MSNTTNIENIAETLISDEDAEHKLQLESISEEIEFMGFIIDLSIKEDLRFECLEKYYALFKDSENCIDLINKITGMYMFSGNKTLSNFLFRICKYSSISTFLKLESAKGLLSFSEILETENEKNPDTTFEQIKKESNQKIILRNKERHEKGFEALNNVCKISHELPTPVRIEAICTLMENDDHKSEANAYFMSVINDNLISCDYRYKTILSLERKKQILNKKFFQKEAFISFFFNDKNMTMYRILSGQYLLQNIEIDTTLRHSIENTLFSFANDTDLDYNLRADSADTLLSLGTDEAKIKARNIIIMLGNAFGNSKTIFENAQNVHTTEIEESVRGILDFLNTIETLQENDTDIKFENIQDSINQILENQKTIKTENICHQCTTTPRGKENILCENLNSSEHHCSEDCLKQCSKHNKIKISLNRIYIDRVLYSKYNNSLINITLKIWSYIHEHEFKEQLVSRLLEELEDMSGTCSTGFASRLCNVISGFGHFNIKISWENQVVANFTGRLNACARKITEPTSKYYTDKNIQNDVIELWLLKNTEELDIYFDMCCREKNISTRNKLKIAHGADINMKTIIEMFLSEDKDAKIERCIEDFEGNVLGEMALNSYKYEDRQHFQRFFRTHFMDIRNEMYEEFKGHVSDVDFDLYIRKAIYTYEGC